MLDVRTKRVYEPAESADGYRVLVDRLWPRGVSRDRARFDEWARELAPSDELRRSYAHDPDRFEQFSTRYREELSSHSARLDELRARAAKEPLTLLYAARDRERNNAAVLAEVLREGAGGPR
jgi:uncharacterized protein YeaO (DUF488 family)